MNRKLAIIGVGKMGHAIGELAQQRGWSIVARLDEPETKAGITKKALNGADVAVEFTTPDAAVDNIRALVKAGVPVVVGTTGWYDRLDEMTKWVEDVSGTMLTASNFSIGVNVFEQVAATAARLLAGAPGFDAQIVEMHHSAKKDAPSGTALTLGAAAEVGWGKKIPIASVRTGSIPGLHEFIFDAPFETIRLTHLARDRRVFAEGALVAAAWLIGKTGVFTMKDVISAGA